MYSEILFIFKQMTAYEFRISDLSSDVCSSDLNGDDAGRRRSDGNGSIYHLSGGLLVARAVRVTLLRRHLDAARRDRRRGQLELSFRSLPDRLRLRPS